MIVAVFMMFQSHVLAPLVEGDSAAPAPQSEQSLSIFGRLQSDFTFTGSPRDAVEFRRIRLGVAGNLSATTSYKVELDFADSANPAKLADVYIQLQDIGPVAIRVGHFKEPFGLDELTSSRFITFMERSLASGFAPARNHGIMMSDSNEQLTWQAGYFYDADSYGEQDGPANNTSYGARVVYRPWISDAGRTLLHLGAALQKRDGAKGFKAYPGSHDSGSWSTTLTNADTTGLEIAFTDGPLNLMVEWAKSDADEGEATAMSAQVSWFLGDQYRSYKTSSAAFGRAQGASAGAWELAARWGDFDFSDAAPGVSGGAKTIALNWNIDASTRVMLDSTQVEPESAAAYEVLAIRFAVDF